MTAGESTQGSTGGDQDKPEPKTQVVDPFAKYATLLAGLGDLGAVITLLHQTTGGTTANIASRLQNEDLNRRARNFNAAVPDKTTKLQKIVFVQDLDWADSSEEKPQKAIAGETVPIPKNIAEIESLSEHQAEDILRSMGLIPHKKDEVAEEYHDLTQGQKATLLIRQVRQAAGLAAYPVPKISEILAFAQKDGSV